MNVMLMNIIQFTIIMPSVSDPLFSDIELYCIPAVNISNQEKSWGLVVTKAATQVQPTAVLLQSRPVKKGDKHCNNAEEGTFGFFA